MPDDATLAKLLSDALTHVESLKTQLAAADARAAHFERLALHNETRLRDAADVLSTLERTMLHARTELARVLPSTTLDAPFKPTPAPTPRAAVVLPTAKTLSFPSLPPPPMHNPQRSVPAVATLAPATAPRSSPQPTTIVATAPAAAPSPATSTGQKRKRADSTDLDDELAAAVDGVSDSASEMSLDDMILAVSGPSPATEHPPTTATATSAPAAAAVPPPRKKPSPSAPATTTATGPAVVHASHNALGQRQCRACGQAGRYKDGKCVEKWGPGPAGPGTVCDRCRKKMKRVERRSDLAQQQQQQQQSSAAASPAPAPATAAVAQSTAPTTPAPSTAAPSPHMRPSTASSSTLSTLSPLAEPERERERVVLPPAKSLGLVGLGLLSSPPLSDAPVPAPVARPFYDAAREVTTTSSTSSSSGASHFGSSRRTSPAPSFAALAGLGGGRFAYEPPTSSVRSYPVSSHRHWRDEVEPVS